MLCRCCYNLTRPGQRTILAALIIIFCPCAALFADFDSADSPTFYINLLTQRGAASFDSSDSSTFYLNLLGIRRAWADSDSFYFDWLSNSQPMSGPVLKPVSLPSGSLLKQFDAYTNTWVNNCTLPASYGDPVVVLNHGWNSSPDSLVLMATNISNRLPGICIYTWDWSDFPDNPTTDANPNEKGTIEDFASLLPCLVNIPTDSPFNNVTKCLIRTSDLIAELQKTMSNAAIQGQRLGDDLNDVGIRPNLYKIHLIGTSYGGVVCAQATKALKKKCGVPVRQLTTIDTPDVIVNAVNTYIDPSSAERVEVIYYNWKGIAWEDVAIPTWALAMGATGGPLNSSASNLLNIKLNPWYYHSITDFPLHFRAGDWYKESVNLSALNCENEPYGFGWSVSLNPTGWEWNNGPLGDENETMGGKGCLTPLAELVVKEVTKAADKVKDEFSSAASYVGQKASLVLDNATNSVVALSLVSGSKMTSGQFLAFDKLDSSSDLNDAYIYKEVNIPAGTDQVALDVRFSAVGEGDKLTLSVGDEILIVVDACAVGVSDTYQTYYSYVGNYAGQTTTIQIALRPSGIGQSVALVDNLRFTTLTLVEDITGDKAVDYADLSILAQNWLIVGCNFRNNCDGADIDRDNKVDFADFARLATYWLEFF